MGFSVSSTFTMTEENFKNTNVFNILRQSKFCFELNSLYLKDISTNLELFETIVFFVFFFFCLILSCLNCHLLSSWSVCLSVRICESFFFIIHVRYDIISGWPRHRENREFGSYFFQTGKTQGILL